ncbi:UDP-3-O-(3-hydroxymyristoyl)glucosamine N-acyltransferase [Bernardetia sp.]|uniref:UDP-3-O-(3-hydroxymyristoyl)glucosamine N-acyltransferase n=1 Tax=Bernardetia sp. TaxID=1937974 RepID=UPI0025BC8B93|nr:UDP-3-O-(3-hydroxymyristoyl)glucosamine N-acyltransferase [Bernardetia sp.]
MELTTQAIANLVGGQVEGDKEAKIHTVAKIQEGTEGAIAFLANPKYENFIYQTKATAVLVSESFEAKETVSTTLIRVPDAYTAFGKLLAAYQQMTQMKKVGIEKPSFQANTSNLGEDVYLGAFSYVGENTKIGNNVKIYPNAYIGDNCKIDDDTIIYAGVKIYSNTQIGKNCVIHSGAVLGSDGFGFAPQKDGSYQPIPQIGNVILEDNVSIGANATIDCATLGSTLIKKGVKIDNLVQIAHNVQIGQNTVIAAQSGVSGSSELGENCILAGQVGVVGHIKIADRVTIAAQSGVSKSYTKKGGNLLGSPANEHAQQLKNYAVIRNLAGLKKKVDELESKISDRL